MIKLLDSENADRDLTSQVTVLTDTPDVTNPVLCQGYVAFGDGSKNLDGTGGDFELTVEVGSQTVEPNPQTVTFSTAVRAGVWTVQFPVPPNTAVVFKVKSPNAADTDVDVTAYLYQVDAVTVSAMDADVLTASAIATDAIDADAIKADAVTLIAAGVAAIAIDTGFDLSAAIKRVLARVDPTISNRADTVITNPTQFKAKDGTLEVTETMDANGNATPA